MRALSAVSLLTAISIFSLAMLIGLTSPMPFESVEEQISTLVKPVAKSEDVVSRLVGLLSIILYNNVGVAVRCVVLGFTLVYPLYVLYANGYMLGSVISFVGYGSLALVPHGIFELPAIIYSSYLGVKIGFLTLSSLTLRVLGKRVTPFPLNQYRESLSRLSLVLLFLVIAAFIEVFISLPIGYLLR
ncbi:MAG: stage II sporulation protein M [Sulfolobales archaeon]